MNRGGGILWRGILVAIVSIAVAGCARLVSTTNYKVTIRVDGRDYTSEVVLQMFSDDNRASYSPYGRVLTFRLPDDRVVVLSTRQGVLLKCVPRLDQSDTGCKQRWSPYSTTHLAPDGFIFDSATNPTGVEAFQFEPRHSDFIASGQYRQGKGYTPMPISRLTIEMVSFGEAASRESRARDDLDRNFPGYDLTHFRDGKPIRDNYALTNAASDIGLPLARDR